MKDNPLLVVVVLAIIAASVIVISGHASDGGGLLAALFTIIGAVGGGHLALSPTLPAQIATDPKNIPATIVVATPAPASTTAV